MTAFVVSSARITAKRRLDAGRTTVEPMTDSIRSVDRALDLLTIVCTCGSEGMSLVDCAKSADLPASTTLRFLRALSQRGFVSRDDDNMFHPGVELLRLGAGVLSRDNLIRVSQPVMQRLAADINESIYLAVRTVDGDCLYIAIAECSQPIRHISWVGKTFHAEGSAADRVLNGEVPMGEAVQERDVVERDVTAISSPIAMGGRIIAAMTALSPSYRMDDKRAERTATLLCKGCRKIAEQLGA